MKLLRSSLLGVCAAALLSAPAFAATTTQSGWTNNWYGGLSGDVTWLHHTNTGGGGNVALGYQLWPSSMGDFRLEAEVGYHGAPNSGGYSGNTHYFTYMGNVYYDFTTIRPWSGQGSQMVPYIGAGLGDATVHFGERRSFGGGLNGTNFRGSDNAFAYQLMAGLTYVSTSMPNADWSVGYRYVGSDRVQGQRLSANNVELGVRFHF